MKSFNKFIPLLICCLSELSLAGIPEELDRVYNSLGYSTNITHSEAYRNQAAGYYTGGSLVARTNIRESQIASIQLPSFRSGCGGIDLFTGGFSFINSQELIDAMKNIANNATSYAFMLAVETVSPLIAEQMKSLQQMANQINQSNINSCETAASLVGGLWPKTDLAQRQVCSSLGVSSGRFADWAKARQGCGSGGERSQILADSKAHSEFKDMVVHNRNLAWEIIRRNSFLANDTELAELFMSLSGTLIFSQTGSNDNTPHQLQALPSLASNANTINALLEGGEGRIYHCDETQACLHPTLASLHIAPHQALTNRVKSLLDAILDKIKTDTPLTQEEIGLLEATRLPIYKMLNVNAAYAQPLARLSASDYADTIARDILTQYLQETLNFILTSSSIWPYPEEVLNQFKQGIVAAMQQVRQNKAKSIEDRNNAWDMIHKTQLLEQQLAGSLSADLTANAR
jgi:conjugative transfer pilus assembly protein TraH